MSVKELGPNFYALEESHPLAVQLTTDYRWYSPKFSPRDVPRFADVSSVTESPSCMRGIRDFLVARYRAMESPPTHILGFDARGFLFGPLVAAELGIPFVLMRKAEKSAGLLIKSEPYDKEYKEAAPEVMTVRYGSLPPGARVVLIDDVLATGGTALSGLQLVEASGAVTVEMACVIALPFLKGVDRIHSTAGGRYRDVVFFAFVLEDALTEANCGDPINYRGPRVIGYADALAKVQGRK